MKVAERPANEDARLRALLEAEVLDTPPEAAFDDLTRLASAICGTPIAVVSLVDADRQWFKSRIGLDGTETSRDVAFCAHAILGEGVFVVRDALDDPRFADNPKVTGDPHIRFYAGAPIRLPAGEQVGTVCVIDRVPRDLKPEQIDALASLSRMAATNLELRRQTRALARASEQLADLLDGTSDLVQSVAPDGRILYANRAWKVALGFGDEALGSLRLPEILAPESQAGVTALLARLESGEVSAPLTAAFVRGDGRHVHVEGTATGKREGTKLLWTRLVLSDVSARVIAEQDRHRFLTAAAEEMRTPLTAVRGALEALADGPLPEDAREVREVAVANTDLLLRQVQDVLDFERLETGTYEIRKAGLDVAEMVRAAAADAGTLAEDRAVTIAAETLPGAAVRGDRGPLQQAAYNLIANAVRRSPPGHTVTVRVTAPRAGTVRLSFVDEGNPVPREELGHVFEAPSRRSPRSRVSSSAIGMALAVTKAIALAHGGDAGVDGREGRGATFWIELPGA